MKIKSQITVMLFCLVAMASRQYQWSGPHSGPQKMELCPGKFKLTPDTKIFADSASMETAQYLATRLRKSTGYPITIGNSKSNRTDQSILLTTQNARSSLAPEGYDLNVAPDSVVIRAPTQAGLFYGAQTLSQLLPPEIFSTNVVTNVDWQMPCAQIEDWPQFKWRGLLLDVSRHFFRRKKSSNFSTRWQPSK